MLPLELGLGVLYPVLSICSDTGAWRPPGACSTGTFAGAGAGRSTGAGAGARVLKSTISSPIGSGSAERGGGSGSGSKITFVGFSGSGPTRSLNCSFASNLLTSSKYSCIGFNCSASISSNLLAISSRVNCISASRPAPIPTPAACSSENSGPIILPDSDSGAVCLVISVAVESRGIDLVFGGAVGSIPMPRSSLKGILR